MQPTISQKFKELLPPLSAEELNQLEESILSDGVRESIKVWRNQIVDGHNRYSICQKHDLPFVTMDMFFANEDEVLEWIYINQLGRRNLTGNQKTLYIGELYELRKKKAGGQIGNGNADKNDVDILSHSFSDAEDTPELAYEIEPQFQPKEVAKRTSAAVARQFGVNEKTVRRAGEVAKAIQVLPQETKSDFLAGKISQKEVVEKAKENLSPELKQAIERKAEIKNGAGARWGEATNKIYVLTTSIRDGGGIEQLSSKWNIEERKYWAEELRRLEILFGEFAANLEKTI